MAKYNHLIRLKETKSKTDHRCDKCGQIINKGDIYFREVLDDKYIRTIRLRKYCKLCSV